MITLRISSSDLSAVRENLLSDDLERCAVMMASPSARKDGALIVHDVIFPNEQDYADQSRIHVELRPEFVARITKQAKLAGMSLVFAHSHPGEQSPHFSHKDDQGERRLAAFLKMRGLPFPHASIVISNGGLRARILGSSDYIRVVSVGERLSVEFQPTNDAFAADLKFDRQVRALGADGQQILESLRVGIVGLGGTGSIAAQQLSHLGVRNFVLIDPDEIDVTNLNRVVGAYADDVHQPKVAMAKRHVLAVAPNAVVTTFAGDVAHASVALKVSDVDVIFCCTDSHGSRSVIQQVAYQYLIPCIDIGSTITAKDGEITGIYGRVQMLGPGHACLWCSGLLNSAEIRRDLMSPYERKLDPYIQGAHEPAPAVISLNGTLVSLAVTMFLGVVTGIPVTARHLIYNGFASSLRPVRASPADKCFICSRHGVLGRGDKQSLFARLD